MLDLSQKAKEARKKVLLMIHQAGTSHIASNFSVIDIATTLYEHLEKQDEVVWSKGWVAATIYYFLAKQGKIPEKDLDKFPNEPYFALAEPIVNGVHVAGGSMGHGLPVAIGMALGRKMVGKKGKIYCIMSDGELNEGTTWEGALLAGHHKLDNLVILIDNNGWQAMGRVEDVLNTNPIGDKFRAFNWEVANVDGHNHEELEKALSRNNDKPYVIIGKTVKGKGVSFFEDHLLYHYKTIDKETYEKALRELI